ncbi:MAG TPA: hypothetical protein PLA88_05410, partial [Bacteroidales bacterium]|nr:hypothetical protein [Bacteroidales bacterium]
CCKINIFYLSVHGPGYVVFTSQTQLSHYSKLEKFSLMRRYVSERCFVPTLSGHSRDSGRSGVQGALGAAQEFFEERE